MINIQIIKAAHLVLHYLIVPAIAVTMTLWPTLSSGLEQLQTDPGDTLLNLYFLEHAFQHFSGPNSLNPDQYWSPNFFWPIRNTLSWSDHLLGPSVLYGVFRFFLDPFQSYVSWLILTLSLNYISIRVAVQRIAPTTAAIWMSIIALATAFSPTITQQLGHPQLLSLFLIGPILVLCHRLIQEPSEDFSATCWLGLASWILSIGFFNIYICVYACYGTLICSIIHLWERLRVKNRIIRVGQHFKRNVVIFISIISANLIIYWPYLQTLKIFGKRPGGEILNNLPKPLSYFYSSKIWLLHAPWTPDNRPTELIYGAEQELFPGWIFLILLTAAIITAVRRNRKTPNGLIQWLCVIAIMVLFSLSWSGISAWPLISKLLPGASSLRASSRIGMMIILFAAPALAIAAQRWKLELNLTRATLVGFLAMLGSFAGIWPINWPSFSLKQWKKELNTLTASLSSSQCSAFWYQWSEQVPWRAHVLAMHAQQRTGIPTANGYSGHFPRDQWPFTNPSGRNAFQWIELASYKNHHEARAVNDTNSWCVATLNSEGSASLRDPEDYMTITTKSVENILLNNGDFLIGSKSSGLYFKTKGQANSLWILISRNDAPVNSDRGDFEIVKAELNDDYDGSLFITDRNIKQGIQYIWIVNAQTGEFLGQTMESLP
ncbi:putative membrane protein [Synechococcus sp. A18-25c]|uniref:hypothetical protein n=1 Tax=Synechococcus sp. A18-25c TaxID=1866938 RepID=UPI0016461B30|nr:hypothetical protein [Synechococcus sp. A18-25c]QNJ18525.1 putative membrane protein [Synechococcus sp. A18-25c]